MKKLIPLVAITFAAMAGNAEAHVGQGQHVGFAQGFVHPFGGLDHVLAMFAVGLFASLLAGKARLLVPVSFVTMMMAGGMLGSLGVQLPFVEIAIALSVVVLGAVVALQWKAPITLALGLVGFFAVFHGFSHAAEMPADTSPVGYGLGFGLATAVLHIAGLAVGLVFTAHRKVLPVGGSVMALAGFGLLSGWF